MPLSRRVVAEFVGTAFLLIAVVGGGIAAERLSPSDTGLQLFESAVVTAFGLAALIMMLGPLSGAHFNPAVTLVDVVLGRRPWGEALPYISAQITGGVAGTVLANLMFDLPAVSLATTARTGWPLWLAELIATSGLLLVIFLMLANSQDRLIGVAVGMYIGGAYFFTSSTSFANPAVTIARMFSDTFAGIEPASAPGFLIAQLLAVPAVAGLATYWSASGESVVENRRRRSS